MNTSTFRIKVVANILIVMVLIFGVVIHVGKASYSGVVGSLDSCDSVALVETTLPWPADIHNAVSEALCNRPVDVLPGEYNRLILTSLDFLDNGSWATATVVMRPDKMPDIYSSLLDFPSLMMVVNQGQSAMSVAFEGQAEFNQMLGELSGEMLAEWEAVTSNREDTHSIQGIPASVNLKWPWKEGQVWKYTQGPHRWSSRNTSLPLGSLDFAPFYSIPANEREIRASATGIVQRKCVDSLQADIILVHGNNYATGYHHLDKNTVSHLVVGQAIQQGSRIGITYNGNNWRSTCGRGTGPHVHFYVGRWYGSGPIQHDAVVGSVISGWTLNSNKCFTKVGESSKCVGSSITSDNHPATMVVLGQTYTGQINPAGEEDLYYFNGASGQNVQIEMTRTSTSIDPYLIIKRSNGSILSYDDDSGGNYNARIRVRLPENEQYQIVAKSISATQAGGYSFQISLTAQDTDDGRWLVHDRWFSGTISPNNDEDSYYYSGVAGRIISLRMNKSGGNLDSWLELYSPNGTKIAWNDDGGGDRNSWLIAVLPSTGTYRVKARSYNHSSSGPYTIRLRMVDANNYATSRVASASSSSNSAYAPARVVDGRMDTRWESRANNQEWVQVDLGQSRSIDSVILRWGSGYASRYGIYVWSGFGWQNVFWTNNGRGGTAYINFPARTTRYVLMYANERATSSGYSLWEFGVYNSALATAPIVPPPNPEKDPDTIETLPPLPLPEEQENKDVLALYIGDGEDAQEVVVTPGEDPADIDDISVDELGAPTALIDYIIPGYPGSEIFVYPDDVLTFAGSAEDNDTDGDPGIVAYEWYSDQVGLLSIEHTFSIEASVLPLGEHLISFRAQDNEDVWSEWDQVVVTIEPYRFFIPILNRAY